MCQLIALVIILVLEAGCSSIRGNTPNALVTAPRTIDQIGDSFFDFMLKKDPFYATYIGDHRYDDQLPNLKEHARTQDYQTLERFSDELLRINPKTLSDAESIRYDVLLQEIETQLETRACLFPLWVVDQLEGPHIALAELAKNQSIHTPEDFKNLIKRFAKAPVFFSDHIANLREGRARGLTAAKITIRHVVDQLDGELSRRPKNSPFMVDTNLLPETFSKKLRKELSKELLDVVTRDVFPSLRAYRDYLKFELLPDAREKVGLHALSIGDNCYRKLIRRHTGLKKTPKQIHADGRKEVERIKAEMVELIKKQTVNTDIKTYMNTLKNDPLQYFKTPDEMIVHTQDLMKRARDTMAKAFGKFPQADVVVVPLEEFREKHAPVAYYYEAAVDGKRPAYYYLNTYRPAIRPIYNMAALAFHEAIPGHHMQIALANENKSIPAFQRHLGQTAFIEGWALYAEFLARELGLYANAEELFGSLNYELWRALRLVVDTGIHDLSWSREQATEYLASNTALSEEEVATEIDRYIIWPAQALAYKVGQMEILSLRAQSQQELGEKFSLSAFHDHILRNGAMPMETLRRTTLSWIKAEKLAAMRQ